MSTEIATTDTPAAAPAGTLAEQMRYAQALAGAGLLPKAYQQRPADLLLALAHADALGLPIAVVLSEVHVIDGKPSVSAGLMAALARRAGHRVRTRVDHDHDGRPVVTCEIRRADDPEYPFVTRWDLDRATRAGLTGKGPWRQYPEQMLRARAVAEAVREACGEVLAGTYTADELAHYPATVPSSPEAVDVTHAVDAATDADPVDAELVDTDPAEPEPEPSTPAAVLDTDKIPNPPPFDRPTDAATRRMWAQLRAAGHTGRDETLAWIGEQIGHRIRSTSELSAADVSTVIDALTADATGAAQ